jgi:asparagine synthase (glutamine-hydrolysing)
MSVQFGRWSFDGMPPLLDYLERVNTLLAPYGLENSNSYQRDGVTVLYHAFHTTKESRKEDQPHVSQSGKVFTWDGRLDNRAEFIALMSDRLETDSPDVSVVASACERWGTRCFPQLLGDWALSIWDPSDQSLTLAKDPIGTRHLYYSVDRSQVAWCTILDPLVLFTGKTFALDEEYIAGWFSFFPAAQLSPYIGIDSVPPSSFVRLQPRKRTITKYWDFDPGKRICYRTDTEYEEHFRNIFGQAVRRRLRSDSPVLAELSGGMDSSSIVCMADTIIARGSTETPRLDTLSFYNESEPNWNERPYFTKVEEKRGRVGCHIDVGAEESRFEFESDRFAATPGSGGGRRTEASRQFAACLASQGNRVVLSGIGGDEVTGGVPTPTPELMDLLARAQFRSLARQLTDWALDKRKPWFHLFFEAARGFFPPALIGLPKQIRPVGWLHSGFIKRRRDALTGYPHRAIFFGPLPSFQENVSTLDMLRRQLACLALSANPPYEKRYPYLDRDLLEFLYAVPREQLVRPSQRRSLMRRALNGIVPDPLLNRKRKAFVVRSPLATMSTGWVNLMDTSKQMTLISLGIVDAKFFSEALQRTRNGQEANMAAMMRTLHIEHWLRNLGIGDKLIWGSPPYRSALLSEHNLDAAPLAWRGKSSAS